MLHGTGNLAGFADLPGVGIIGGVDNPRREGLVALTVEGVPAPKVVARLRDAGIRVHVRKDDHYSGNILKPLGLASCVRVSMCHYNTREEVARFLTAMRTIDDLTRTPPPSSLSRGLVRAGSTAEPCPASLPVASRLVCWCGGGALGFPRLASSTICGAGRPTRARSTSTRACGRAGRGGRGAIGGADGWPDSARGVACAQAGAVGLARCRG